MSRFRYVGFYGAHYDTPTGSMIVEPGAEVDWPDGPPDGWWLPDVDAVIDAVTTTAKPAADSGSTQVTGTGEDTTSGRATGTKSKGE